MRAVVFILLFTMSPVTVFAGAASSTELAFSRNSRTFEGQQSSLTTKGLAYSCLTMPNAPDGLPCNPALTTLTTKSKFEVRGLVSNGYSNLQQVQRLLDSSISQDDVDSIFTSGRILQIEASANLSFKSKYLNGQYTPFDVKGFSVVRNEASPDVEISAIEEKGFTFQSGYGWRDTLYGGLQTRIISRKFVHKRFRLVELGTEAGKDLLKPKTQTATYFEPGATWVISSQRKFWVPRVSVLVANLGFVSEDHPELEAPIDPQFGLGISPNMSWGKMDLSLEYRGIRNDEPDIEKLRAGLLYRFGSMNLMGGIDFNGLSSGVYFELEKFSAGILYATTQLLGDDSEAFTQTAYVQVGWQI